MGQEDEQESTAPWVKNRDRMACVVCHKRFTLLKRRHHCRSCGEVICGGCSQHAPLKARGKAVRICVACAGCKETFAAIEMSSRSGYEDPAEDSGVGTPRRERALSTLSSWFPGVGNQTASTEYPEPPLPSDEEHRLNAVRQLHIDGIMQVCDMYCDVAAKITKARIAMVGLMEEEQQLLLSCTGLNRDRIPRKLALCAHTICSPTGQLVVLDTKKDPRFANSPLVQGRKTGVRIRYYAGVTIFDQETRHALGTVAVMDTKPRRRAVPGHLQVLHHLSILVSAKFAQLEAESDSETL